MLLTIFWSSKFFSTLFGIKRIIIDEALVEDRASRFVWNLECGKKEQELFLQAMQIVKELIEQTEYLSLLTDGEIRYGNLLFDIFHELVRYGNRGSPPKEGQE